ncbi:carbohydrate ABC transporter permease [Nonomuraea sediminis]|uniref:carbohydrate ABC transporter permease n=1 Tax=Nonomuraea sediminis TaxID=2835864 RepID=UPI001BDC167B|nr:carbohydrate ABC transporter permease [Nonomuraea sediminis]
MASVSAVRPAVRGYTGLAIMATAFLLPFVVMVATSFKSPQDVFAFPPRLLPQHWVSDNYAEATRVMPFWRYLLNTVWLCAVTMAGSVLSCPLVAYALSKLRWRGRGVVFFLVVATMMLPPQVTLIPVYLVWNKLGLAGTYWPLVVPSFLGTPFFIFLLRQFLMNVPDELLEAARIDGASEFAIYWRLVLPLTRPALITVAVFQFVWTWTDFLSPLIYLNDTSQYTLSIGLYNFFSEHGVAWGPLMAACLMFAAPALVIFVLGQRYFVDGIATSGLK